MTYRDPEGLRRTLDSLDPLMSTSSREVECIVVDGGTDLELLASAMSGAQFQFDLSSEPDHGIYDAMNKGIERSSGDFVWFLNGGDESQLRSLDTIGTKLAASKASIFFGAYVLVNGDRRTLRRARSASYIWHGLPTSHQAILYPGNILRETKYDLQYTVVGDYELTARLLESGVSPVVLEETIAAFHAGGMSQQRAKDVSRQARSVQRTLLGSPWYVRELSRFRHLVSRNLRAMQESRAEG